MIARGKKNFSSCGARSRIGTSARTLTFTVTTAMNRRKRRFVDPTNENFRRKGTRSLSAVVDDAANSFSGTTTSNTRAAPISSVTDGTTFELHDRTTVERGSASTFSSSNDFGGTGARLYVGNLDLRVSEGDILKIF